MRVFLLSLLALTICSGQPVKTPTAVITSSYKTTLPQLVAGGGWQTSIYLTNVDQTDTAFTLSFFDASGAPMPFSFVGQGTAAATMKFTLKPRQGVKLVTSDGASLQQGWAMIDGGCCNDYVGFGVFKQVVAGRPDMEAVVPLAEYGAGQAVLLLDGENGYASGLAIVNPDSYKAASVTLTFRDLAGERVMVDQIDLPKSGKAVFDVASKYPQIAGRVGMLELSTPGYVSVLGLRFNPTGAFTSSPGFRQY